MTVEPRSPSATTSHGGLPGRPGGAVLRLIERLAEIGARPGDSHDERLRAGTLILASVWIAVLAFVWIGTYLAYDLRVSAAIPFVYQVVTLIGLAVLSRTKRFGVFRTTQMTTMLVLPALLQASLGGFVASSAMITWSVFVPLIAIALLGVRAAVPWLVAFLLLLLTLTVLDPYLSRDPAPLPDRLVVVFFVLNLAGLTAGTFAMLAYFVHQSRLAQSALQIERERSERLLLNVLPVSIAERLKRDEGRVIAEHHDAVTVLFADLVDFTAHTVELAPRDLVSLLDGIFSAFDLLVDAEGLEKIKTIGDAYMVVGGAPEARHDHVAAVARVAIAMQEAVARIGAERGMPWLAIRAGIDTGPAVAGVIGHRKFIYDLWGDTVNTASRMESHGVPGEIQVTDRAAARLRAAGFSLAPRGSIDVKGKGAMEPYLLVAPPPSGPSAS